MPKIPLFTLLLDNMLQLNLLQEPQHIIPISGKDSLACALWQTTRRPDIPYKFIFNDTGSELPEVYAWLEQVEQKTGWRIIRTNVTIEDLIITQNYFLPSHQNRWCTKYAKIRPTDKLTAGAPTFIYYGLRSDEPERKGFIPTRSTNIFPVYPLREAGLDLSHVWAIVEAQGLDPPSFRWKRLEMAVLAKLPKNNWLVTLAPWMERMIFAGRTRSNCFHCFYQRLYEWLWLKETHPELFLKSRSWEKSNFFWNEKHPLSDFDDPSFCDRVFNRRVAQLVRILSGQEKEGESIIASVSCGLICGK